MQVIETYPNLLKAYLAMERCNGGINRYRSEEQACRESDPVIGAEGVDHSDLIAIDTWLSTLSEDDLLTLTDGEESDVEAITAMGGEVGMKAHALLGDLFDNEIEEEV